jgi:hypothetical protein
MWIATPAPPIRPCDPVDTAAGANVYVLDYGLNNCPYAFARYDATTNSWTRLAAPPKPLGDAVSTAWDGQRLIVVADESGATYAFQAATDRWQELGSLPRQAPHTGHSIDLYWTGSSVLANVATAGITGRDIRATVVPTTNTFALGTRGDWSVIATMAEPSVGTILGAPMVGYDNEIYAWVEISVLHTKPVDYYTSGSATLRRLTDSAWEPTAPTITNPISDVSLGLVGNAIVATGSECPPGGVCMQEDGSASLTRPGVAGDSRSLTPPYEVPYPSDIAAGAEAVVVTYPSGSASLGRVSLGNSGPRPGTTVIDDLSQHTWLPGPTAPTGRRSFLQAFWTSAGVVLLPNGGKTGWLLQPYPGAL